MCLPLVTSNGVFDIVCKWNLIRESANLAAADEDCDGGLDMGEEANEIEDGGSLDVIKKSW